MAQANRKATVDFRVMASPWRGLAAGVALACSMMAQAGPTPQVALNAAPLALRCTLSAPAQVRSGQAVPLSFTLHNDGRVALAVLNWGTPFEGWLAPFVTVKLLSVKLQSGTLQSGTLQTDKPESQELPYRGAAVKRGDPGADEYLRLAAGRTRSVSLDLALAFDMKQPGRYRIEPHLMAHDVVVSRSATLRPRPRSAHVPMALPCPAIELDVLALL